MRLSWSTTPAEELSSCFATKFGTQGHLVTHSKQRSPQHLNPPLLQCLWSQTPEAGNQGRSLDDRNISIHLCQEATTLPGPCSQSSAPRASCLVLCKKGRKGHSALSSGRNLRSSGQDMLHPQVQNRSTFPPLSHAVAHGHFRDILRTERHSAPIAGTCFTSTASFPESLASLKEGDPEL